MSSEGKGEGHVNMRFGRYNFDQTSGGDVGAFIVQLSGGTSRYHFEGLDLTFNLVTANATMDRILWEIMEQDAALTLFDLYEGFFNTKVSGEAAGQQGFSSSTKWIGFINDAVGFRWTNNGAIAGAIFKGNFAVSAVAPHGVP